MVETYAIEFRDLIGLRRDLAGDIFVIWGIHTTVALAMIGWFFSKRSYFLTIHKAIATFGYSVVVCLVIFSLYHVYSQLQLLSIDIAHSIKLGNLKLADGGYLQKITDPDTGINYTSLSNSLWRSIPIAVLFYIFMLFLIWNDWVWEKLKVKD